jgi:hypothetical protein
MMKLKQKKSIKKQHKLTHQILNPNHKTKITL